VVAIDRAARARRRWQRRAAQRAVEAAGSRGSAVLGVEGLFSTGARHQLEHLAWVEVAREDERESGGEPTGSQVIRLRRR